MSVQPLSAVASSVGRRRSLTSIEAGSPSGSGPADLGLASGLAVGADRVVALRHRGPARPVRHLRSVAPAQPTWRRAEASVVPGVLHLPLPARPAAELCPCAGGDTPGAA